MGHRGFEGQWTSLYDTTMVIWVCQSCSVVSRLFVTPWTVGCQAPLSMGFSRQEYWRGLPLQGIFPTQGLNLGLLLCRHSLPSEPKGSHTMVIIIHVIIYISKPTERTTQRVKHNISYGVCTIIMHQCRFINCNKHTSLMGDVDKGRSYTWMGARSI